MRKDTPWLLAVVLAATGLILSAVLEYVHIKTYLDVTADSFCNAGETLDCRTVALSRFSVVLGIPLPVWGIVGFAAMLGAAWRRSVLLLPLAAFSVLASIALFIEELVGVGAVCLLCEAVHLVCIALAIVAWRMPDKRPIDRDELVGTLGVAAIGLVVARIAIPPYWHFVLWTSGPPLPTGTDEAGLAWIGAEQPELVVHEFVDYACPHCATASNRMRLEVLDHPDTLRIVRGQQPRVPCRPNVPSSCLYTRGAICAGDQGKFWEMDSWLFAHAPGHARIDLGPAVDDVGLDRAQFETCLTAEETYGRAEQQRKIAVDYKIRETPGYVIDGEKMTYPDAREIVDERL